MRALLEKVGNGWMNVVMEERIWSPVMDIGPPTHHNPTTCLTNLHAPPNQPTKKPTTTNNKKNIAKTVCALYSLPVVGNVLWCTEIDSLSTQKEKETNVTVKSKKKFYWVKMQISCILTFIECRMCWALLLMVVLVACGTTNNSNSSSFQR